MVRVAVRGPPLLAATVNVTVPSPVPFDPDVIVTHGASLVAVQVQPGAGPVWLTAMDPVPPLLLKA